MKDKDIRLKDFKSDEHVLVVVRRHWFVYLKAIVGLLILFFIPFFAIPILSIFITAGTPTANFPAGIGFFAASFWALILWQIFFAKWTNFYYDMWIVTNWRIVDIEQKGFFNRDIATLLNFEQIQDIKTYVDSVIGTFLHFGCIQIQTAAAHREFLFKNVGNPTHVEKVIRDAQEKSLGIKSKL